MSPRFDRVYLDDGSFIEISIEAIDADPWRPHGYRYRCVWVQEGRCRVLFDNHHGKADHVHVDQEEFAYAFIDVETLMKDFWDTVQKKMRSE